jgi:Family of unknown function (DUF5343)
MSTESTTTTAGMPYMSWGSFENLIDRFARDGMPPRIDRSIVAGSEGQKTQVLNGLRWLELIEEDGSPTATFDQIVKAEDRSAELGKLLREKYARQITLGEQNASQRALDESFQPLTGETARKAASFYLKAAKYAGLPTSPYFKVPRTRRAKPASAGKTGAKSKGQTGAGGGRSRDTGLDQVNGLHPAVAGLLKDLPREGGGWASDDARDAFLTTFEALVKYAIPVTGEVPTSDVADDELAEDDE